MEEKKDDIANRYCHPDYANVRYLGETMTYCENDGWCYILTKDDDYVHRLASKRTVQTRNEYGEWQQFHGELLPDPNDELLEIDFT